jgi:hypothetical protein
MVAFERRRKGRARQDMVEPAAAVGLAPVVVAVAPPRIELVLLRHEAARHVDPAHRRHHLAEQLDLNRRVRHDLQELLVAPHVMLERRHVEVADGDAAQAPAGARLGPVLGVPVGHLAVEGELVRELLVLPGVGDVAARRDVEIVEQDGIAADVEGGLDMPAVLLAAAMMDVGGGERHLREDGDAVVGFHALHQPVPVAQRFERQVREDIVRALGLLQAEHVGLAQLQEPFDVGDPQADRIDVPGGDGQTHRRHYR